MSTQLSFARAGHAVPAVAGADATGAQTHNAVAGDAEIVAVVTGVLLPAQSVGVPEWIDRLSSFAHLALVPDMPPDWAGTAGLSAVAVALMIIGVVGYTRRDLAV